jgi:hypothetical protein
LQFTPSNATPKIAKEYVFANASKFAEKSLWVTMYIKKIGQFWLISKVILHLQVRHIFNFRIFKTEKLKKKIKNMARC